ncbi:MAG: dehydrogenase [Chitinophagaceae bacterium]|nr:dehydrogenase [Chitinophagaceae bacterium]MCW5929083.1 dehydrogenase [Chitinophagaceae bacterium]
MKPAYFLLTALYAAIALSSCGDAPLKIYDDPKTVEEEIKSFQLVEGFAIKNVAAEPDIVMPVSMAIDEDGITYVVQMSDYPFIPDSLNGKCSIKVLFDNNNDGLYDSSVLFVGGVPDITSVLPYKKGLLVTSAPYIFFMQDTTGDFVADKVDTLFSGFFTGNSEAQITNLTYGLDNWIYANNHGQAGQVKFLLQPGKEPLSVTGQDFRFRLDKGLYEAESGNGQFGLALNDLNHRFYTQNTLHIQTNPIPYRYLRRHPFLSSYRADRNISDHELEMFQLTPPPYWRKTRSERRQRQYDSLNLNRIEWADKHFTGASGATFYGGDAFPVAYYGSVFTGEVAGNLIHRDVLVRTENDITYTASRGENEKDKEFLASTDSWFRPASFYSGPDGNLFVVDMYRQHIETPVSIPEDLKEDMDFYAGNDMGRIFLIMPNGYNASGYRRPAMSLMTSADLVPLLEHPNAWWRTQAQRLLVERQDKSVAGDLRKILNSSQAVPARLRALYTLEGLDALNAEDVSVALKDKDAGLREHGIQLAERFPVLANEIIRLVDDPAKFVAFQAVLSAGNLPPGKAIPALVHALNRYQTDSLFTIAVLTARPGIQSQMLPALVKAGYFEPAGKFKEMYLEALGYAFGLQDLPGNMPALLALLSAETVKRQPEWLKAAANGLIRGTKASKREKHSPELIASLKKLADQAADEAVKKQLTEINTEGK